MEVIISPGGAGFDGLAAMVACGKLHPQAIMALAGGQLPGVRRFISAHREFLPLYRAEGLSLDQVTTLHLIGEDREGLGLLAELRRTVPNLVVHGYCPPSAGSPGPRPVGALTTLLLSELEAEGLPVSPFEATLFLLGIYGATDCLTSVAVTSRDTGAAGWLLDRGGNLPLVGKYLDLPLTVDQLDLAAALIQGVRHENINGRSVLFMTADLKQFVSGLGDLTQRLLELESCDLALSVVQMADRVHLVARTLRPDLDLRTLLRSLPVRGGAGAVAATVTGVAPAQLCGKAAELLQLRLPLQGAAGNIMSAPVRTVSEDTSIAEVQEFFQRFGHTGVPVTDRQQRITGILTRGDVEGALRQGLGQAPAREYMSRSLLTIDIHSPIDEVSRILLYNDIGRVPVLDQGRLVGIITRSDLLRHLGGPGGSPGKYRLAAPGDNLAELVKSRLPQRTQGFLMLLGEAAQQQGIAAYAVGGFVRDLLLGLPVTDLDVALEGDAVEFSRQLAAATGGRLAIYPELGTASLTLAEGFRVDFATARRESYQFPGATPRVEETTIKEDLYRRDFTINTLAFALNTSQFGQFLDFFNGWADLQAGLVRVLYNLSFVDDPTRILRAVRFAGRYGFRLDGVTQDLMSRAVADGMLAKASVARIGREMRLLFHEANAPALLGLAREQGLLDQLLPGINWNGDLTGQIAAAARLNRWQAGTGTALFAHLLYPLILLKAIDGAIGEETLGRLGLDQKEAELVGEVGENLAELHRTLAGLDTPGETYDLLRNQPPLALLALLAVYPGEPVQQAKVLLYLDKQANLKTAIGGNDLLELGIEPGPEMGEILRAVHRAKIEGRVHTREEELALAVGLHREGK